LLDKSVNSLGQRLDKLYPGTSSNSDGIKYWKGRKIIPLDKWLKITKANNISRSESYNVKEGLQYFPDDYFKWMFPLGIPENIKEEGNKWYSDYIELMEYRKNSRYGKTKCFRCLLSPDREEAAIFIGINKVIARAIEQENNISSSTISYPCPILNRYACPFDKKKNNDHKNNIHTGEEKEDSHLLDIDDLFNLSEIAFQVELAFSHAYSMSKSNETIYETDFEAGKVKEIYANYHGDPYSFSTEYPLKEKLSKVYRLSKVPIRNVQDVYNALTDRETLNKVLEQGLDEEYLRYKDQLIEFFMSIKDRISIEDLRVYEPTFTSTIQKSKCSICNEFANIHCINCRNNNVWLCVDHWKQHKAEAHS
jgi:hypothetical protein